MNSHYVLRASLRSGTYFSPSINSKIGKKYFRDYMHQILLGVQHMHAKDIVHLDLKV